MRETKVLAIRVDGCLLISGDTYAAKQSANVVYVAAHLSWLLSTGPGCQRQGKHNAPPANVPEGCVGHCFFTGPGT